MATELNYPYVEKREGEPARLERIPRVRIAQIVMDYLEHGWSVDEMCRQHPYLRLSEAHSAMAYYFDHQEEIHREIAEEIDQVVSERIRSARSPIHQRLRSIR
jgi:uncharacterized protein (DUF433 family)